MTKQERKKIKAVIDWLNHGTPLFHTSGDYLAYGYNNVEDAQDLLRSVLKRKRK